MTRSEKHNARKQFERNGWRFYELTKNKSGIKFNVGYRAIKDEVQIDKTSLELLLTELQEVTRRKPTLDELLKD